MGQGAERGTPVHRAGRSDRAAVISAPAHTVRCADGDVGAWAHRGDRDALLEAAAALDTMRSGGLAGGALSPLFGIPFAAKDIIQSRDFPTEYGSAVFRGNAELNQPAADAACIAQLKSRGALLIGKTDTTEFATFSANSSHNPHDPTRTPGGSSSGSAAAVADMQVPVALGTQTNGSVIRPAGFCGVCGYDLQSLIFLLRLLPASLSNDRARAGSRARTASSRRTASSAW